MLKKTFASALTLLFSLLATDALAIQEHVDPEGYYIHQYAHVVFIAAMIFMMVVLKKPSVFRLSGWRSIRWASFFFMLWNTDALFSHMASFRMEPASSYIQGSVIWLKDFQSWFFYCASLLEYLFLAPGFIFLAVGINQLIKHIEKDSAR